MQKNVAQVLVQLKKFQQEACRKIEIVEGQKSFALDAWDRPQGGGGISCVLEEGRHIERGGVNFSHVFGSSMPPSATAHRPELQGRNFEAMGVSIVIHPKNPYAPTSHLNTRLFVAYHDKEPPIWWFGGGFDLTPYYGFEEDCVEWHQFAKSACDVLTPHTYLKYKKWCDEYFYLKHRAEPRGIGGIFYDDLNMFDFEKCFEFHQQVAANYLKAYIAILSRRIDTPFGEKERAHQLIRRGRYVEFNLLYDRGTLFGLQSNGRTESILMSLPPLVGWSYTSPPVLEGSSEARLYKEFLVKKDWLNK